ncbi:MAG: hypothetical protein M3R24_35745 [Chloroflexota bacterium]|nr:hypothetical protein [Chloroflexota bacterium]
MGRTAGTIATPPRLRRHEVESSLEFARTSLLVQVQQPSRRPGVAALRMKEDRVPIDVPVALLSSTFNFDCSTHYPNTSASICPTPYTLQLLWDVYRRRREAAQSR